MLAPVRERAPDPSGLRSYGRLVVAPPVILVSHGFQTNYERGFSNGVASLGIAATLIASDSSDVAGLDPRLKVLNLRGSQDARRSRLEKAANQLRYLGRLLLHVARHRGETVHVIGLIEPPLLYGLALGLALRVLSRRYVLTVHNLLPHDRRDGWQRLWFGMAFRLPQRLVVHTEAMRRSLVERFGLPASRIVHMEHGLEPFGEEPVAQPRRPADATQDELRLLAFGVLKHYKGLDVLLEALEDIDLPFRLEIRGLCTSEELVRDIEARLLRHPRREAIHWQRSFVGEDEVPGLFAAADALVLPYRAIDQSGVLFQALRHGVPVVATKVGSFPEYVVPAVGELCEPGDPVSLRAALLRLQARRGELRRADIRAHGRRYEWPVTVRALESVYAA